MVLKKNEYMADENKVSWGTSSRLPVLRVFNMAIFAAAIPVAIIIIIWHPDVWGELLGLVAGMTIVVGIRGLWWLRYTKRRMVITDEVVFITDRLSRPVELSTIQRVSWMEADDRPEWVKWPTFGQLVVMDRRNGPNGLPMLFAVSARDRKTSKEFVEREFGKRGIEVRINEW